VISEGSCDTCGLE